MIFKSPSIHRTPLYRAKATYRGMVKRCGNKNGLNPTYVNVQLKLTEQEFLDWAIPKYEQFLKEHPTEIPNVARFNDSGDYELGNIQLITRDENMQQRQWTHRLQADGTKICDRCERKLIAKDNFTKSKGKFDGLDQWCKQCKHAVNTLWRQRRNKLAP
jgi:hypothetical protein